MVPPTRSIPTPPHPVRKNTRGFPGFYQASRKSEFGGCLPYSAVQYSTAQHSTVIQSDCSRFHKKKTKKRSPALITSMYKWYCFCLFLQKIKNCRKPKKKKFIRIKNYHHVYVLLMHNLPSFSTEDPELEQFTRVFYFESCKDLLKT